MYYILRIACWHDLYCCLFYDCLNAFFDNCNRKIPTKVYEEKILSTAQCEEWLATILFLRDLFRAGFDSFDSTQSLRSVVAHSLSLFL
jgi:hypothetical protein